MHKKIAVIAGDGIGPEIVAQAQKTLEKIGKVFGHTFEFMPVWAGGCATDRFGVPLPEESITACQNADSVLLGAVGGPKWDGLDPAIRPEKALLGIRKALGLYANIRPATLLSPLRDACPLKKEISDKGLDLVVVRELTGGIYFGERGVSQTETGEKKAYDTLTYTEHEIERIARTAFELAMKRRKQLVSVDKANVLASSRLWREVMHRIKDEYPEVSYSDMLVDNCAMQLVRDPSQFDVVVTENMFGDILSDEASMLTGSIGMIPSMSLGEGSIGLYEPIHGSAPDLAGQDAANPIATILSAAMMLRYSFGMEEEAQRIEGAVAKVLEAGYATGDIMAEGKNKVGCSAMGDLICEAI
jgi:3-isopropylmalate dehydrogenase